LREAACGNKNLGLLKNQVDGKVVEYNDKQRWVKKSHLCLNWCMSDAKTVGGLGGAGVMVGKKGPPGYTSTRPPLKLMQYSVMETRGYTELTKT
jgi:hypothetical protein